MLRVVSPVETRRRGGVDTRITSIYVYQMSPSDWSREQLHTRWVKEFRRSRFASLSKNFAPKWARRIQKPVCSRVSYRYFLDFVCPSSFWLSEYVCAFCSSFFIAYCECICGGFYWVSCVGVGVFAAYFVCSIDCAHDSSDSSSVCAFCWSFVSVCWDCVFCSF